jgi:hypothetical protein
MSLTVGGRDEYVRACRRGGVAAWSTPVIMKVSRDGGMGPYGTDKTDIPSH